MDLMIILLSGIVGFVLGVSVTFVVLTKFSSKHKIQDELTRSKRELANAKRLLDEFFVNSSELFSQVTKSYAAFADYMQQSAEKLSPDNQDLYSLDFKSLNKGAAKGDDSKKSLKESLMALKEQVSDITASIEEEEKKVDSLNTDKKAEESPALVNETEGSDDQEVKPKVKEKEKAKEASADEEAEKSAVKQKTKVEPEKPEEADPAPMPVKDAAEKAPAPKTEAPTADEELPQPPKDFVENKEPAKI